MDKELPPSRPPSPTASAGDPRVVARGQALPRKGGGDAAASGEGAGKLAENILYFARALRAAGLPVGPGAVLDALEAVSVARVGNRDDFYWTLHAVFVKRHEHTILFDQAFKLFFRKRGYIEQLIAAMLPEAARLPPKPPAPGAQRVQEALYAGLNQYPARRPLFSGGRDALL